MGKFRVATAVAPSILDEHVLPFRFVSVPCDFEDDRKRFILNFNLFSFVFKQKRASHFLAYISSNASNFARIGGYSERISTFTSVYREIPLVPPVYLAPAKMAEHKQDRWFSRAALQIIGMASAIPPGPFLSGGPSEIPKINFSPGASIKRSFSVFDVGPDEPSDFGRWKR